jgi:uncharacterized protein YjbJ (UPF0337 family)
MEAANRKNGEQLRKLLNNKFAVIAGKYEELIGGVQEKYGIAEASHRMDEYDMDALNKIWRAAQRKS